MASSSEDVLGELYGWDSTIDEMYERGVDHADFDEDEALEAYEEMILVASRAEDAADAVLSLAAQLLTKHFNKFPHVHMNVVNVLLDLLAPAQSQAVRIHTVRSLLQIVKGARQPPLVQACRDRITDRVGKLLAAEKSNVIVRHLTQLQETLAAIDDEPKGDDKQDQSRFKRDDSRAQGRDEEKSRQREEDEKRREQARREEEIRREEARREESKREKREERFGPRDNFSDDGKRYDRDERRGRDDQERSYRPHTEQSPRDHNDNARDRRPPIAAKEGTGNGCPPSSFIFIGGVPRETTHSDIIKYLSCIDESITHSCVQIKFPSMGRNAAGYAFVSLETKDHARKAIRHIQTTEFNGRTLIGDFARGPPCSTLQFVERTDTPRMQDPDSVRQLDVNKLDPGVWRELCDTLEMFGSLEDLGNGRIRFRDTESAKSVIRKHHFTIRGREFLPVYDPEEQAEIDSSRRRPRRDSRDGEGGDGRGVRNRYVVHDHTDRRGSRDDGERKRRRSTSPDRDHRDKAPRWEQDGDRRHQPQFREFDQARYGPSEPAGDSNRRDGNDGKGGFSKHRDSSRVRDDRDDDGRRDHSDRRGSDRDNNRRSRSTNRAPHDQFGGNKSHTSHRSRSRSPTVRKSEGRERSFEQSGRSRSPVRQKSFKSSDHERHSRPNRDDYQRSFGDGPGSKHRSRSPERRHGGSPPHRRTEEGRQDKQFSRYPSNQDQNSDDRRPRGDFRQDNNQRAPQRPRERSRSPRGSSPQVKSFDSSHRRGPGDRHEHHRESWSNNQNGQTGFQHRHHSEGRPSGDDRRDQDRGFVDRRNSQQHKMSKYGTLGGEDQSPSPPRFRDQDRSHHGQSYNRDYNNRASGDGEGKKTWSAPESGFRRYGNGQGNRPDGDQRSRPFVAADNHRQQSSRGRSPEDRRTTARDERNDASRHRSRSPQPRSDDSFKKRRSRSPARDFESRNKHDNRFQRDNRGNRDGHDDRGRRDNREARPGYEDRRKHGDHDRRPNRSNGNYDRNHQENERRDNRGGRDENRSNRFDRDESPFKQKPRDSEGPSQSPSRAELREQRTRSASPVPGEDSEPRRESPRAAAKANSTGAIEDIDECMVDYDEDEE